MVERDLRTCLFLAYQKGAFRRWMPDDLTQENFPEAFRERAAAISTTGYILEIRVGPKMRPIGVVLALIDQHRLEPLIDWFPWATPRNRYEATVEFINEARREYVVIAFAREEAWNAFERVCRHGIARRVGKMEDHFDWGEPAMVFQSIARAF